MWDSFYSINLFSQLTDPMLSRRGEELTPCNRARRCSSTYRIAPARASTPSIFHIPPREASQGMRRADRQPPTIRLNSLLHFEGFSLTVLLLLQIHFLQIEKTFRVERGAKVKKEINLQCKCYSFAHVKRQWIEYFPAFPRDGAEQRDENCR